jgi:hypothetical protein
VSAEMSHFVAPAGIRYMDQACARSLDEAERRAVDLRLLRCAVADITQPAASATSAELTSRFGDLCFPAFNRWRTLG